MTLALKDLPACPEGMNQDATPWMIPDSQARWLEDFLLHRENEMTRRGPIIPKSGWPSSMTEKGIGLEPIFREVSDSLNDAIYGGLSNAQREQLESLLDHVYNRF